MNIPNAVRIGGYRYEIERPEGPFYTDSGDLCDGLHVPNVQVIKVAKDGNDEYQKTVFLHECLHAIIYTFCGNLVSDDDEEKLVENLAKGMYQFIKDNPSVFENREAFKEGD